MEPRKTTARPPLSSVAPLDVIRLQHEYVAGLRPGFEDAQKCFAPCDHASGSVIFFYQRPLARRPLWASVYHVAVQQEKANLWPSFTPCWLMAIAGTLVTYDGHCIKHLSELHKRGRQRGVEIIESTHAKMTMQRSRGVTVVSALARLKTFLFLTVNTIVL